MRQKQLEITLDAVERFKSAALNLQVAHAKRNKDPETHRTPEYFGNLPKEQGAVRRASLDLTRALADLRRSTPFAEHQR